VIVNSVYKTQTTGPPDGLLEGRDTSEPCAEDTESAEAMPLEIP